MNIVVCMKQTPDTEAKIVVNADGSGINTDGIKYVMNPYDEYAVEQAIQLKEKHGGEAIIVTLGGSQTMEAMRTALAMGMDRGVRIEDPALEKADTWTTAKALAAAIKQQDADIVLGGKQAIDSDVSAVMGFVAELLDVPQASNISSMEIADDAKSAKVGRRIEGGEEVIEISLPAVMSCEKGLNEPRYASLPGIMKSKRKEIKEMNLEALGLSADEVKPKIVINKFLPLEERQAGKIIEGEPAEAAFELARLLREEAKVI